MQELVIHSMKNIHTPLSSLSNIFDFHVIGIFTWIRKIHQSHVKVTNTNYYLKFKKHKSLHTFYPDNGVAILCIFHNQPYNKTMHKRQKYDNQKILLYERSSTYFHSHYSSIYKSVYPQNFAYEWYIYQQIEIIDYLKCWSKNCLCKDIAIYFVPYFNL